MTAIRRLLIATSLLALILPRDFLPVGSLAQLSVFICASPQSGIKTLPDLIARAKERPGEISFAGTGMGRITHLTGLLLESRAGIKLQAVPYAGGPAAALTDVIGGRVPLIIVLFRSGRRHSSAQH